MGRYTVFVRLRLHDTFRFEVNGDMIRISVKAIILRDGKLLLNRCKQVNGEEYYDLPGGGQELYEPMEETVIREVLEETGYHIRILRFAAFGEEIYTDERLRLQYPDYTHRVFPIFLAALTDEPQEKPTEQDVNMQEVLWVPVEETAELPRLCPPGLSEALPRILQGASPVCLGTGWCDWPCV